MPNCLSVPSQNGQPLCSTPPDTHGVGSGCYFAGDLRCCDAAGWSTGNSSVLPVKIWGYHRNVMESHGAKLGIHRGIEWDLLYFLGDHPHQEYG